MVNLPWQIKEALRRALSSPERRACRRRWRNVQKSSSSDPRLAFGGVLDDGGLVHGGAVKLLALRDAFSSDETSFNLLYLVSSAQPEFAEEMVAACRSRGIRLVWNQNGVGYPGWAGSEAERHNAPMRRLRAAADTIIYQSEFCRAAADQFLGPCPVEGEVLWNPVDLEKFHPGPSPAGPLRLLTLGTHNYAERVLAPIQCLKALRDAGQECTLTIAGRMLWSDAERIVRDAIVSRGLGEAVTVRPAFDQDEAARMYRDHHILLHPKYLDPCPTVVIEALASGLPVIGSASGGLPEMVPADGGRLIPVPQVWDRLITPTGEELAGAVQSVQPHLSDMSRCARRHAENHFGAPDWVARHGEIFRKLLA
jgi:glycosyltransferase involved in cell wall biosynthesis